jgi:1-acyl-sn-glycerol-3-phosphate acyltransferase
MAPPKPRDYRPPPRPSLADAARTARALATDMAPALARLALHGLWPAPSTTTPAGLRATRASFSRALRHLGVELSVLRADALPRAGGLVLLWNQESHLDHLVLASAIPRPFFSLYNNAIARFPVYGRHMRATGHVHVDRGDEAQWRPAIAAAARRVREGEAVLVSPEGTRSWDTRLLPMKRGALALALSAARPTVCVTVIGGHARLPRGAAVVRAGPLRVVFSDPIAPGEDPDALAAAVEATFTALKRAYPLA